jgi:hypothetical protein
VESVHNFYGSISVVLQHNCYDEHFAVIMVVYSACMQCSYYGCYGACMQSIFAVIRVVVVHDCNQYLQLVRWLWYRIE